MTDVIVLGRIRPDPDSCESEPFGHYFKDSSNPDSNPNPKSHTRGSLLSSKPNSTYIAMIFCSFECYIKAN